MVASELRGAAEAGAAVGRANAEAILGYLQDHGAGSAPAIAKALGLSEPVVRGHLRRLAETGLAVKHGTRWSVSPVGVGRSTPASVADVARVLDLLPSEAHRAIARLVLAAVVARRTRAQEGVTGWPSFGLWGPPGTAKTTVGRLLARLLGLPEYEVVRVASDLDRAELLGRRVPDGKGGYRFSPAPALGRPLLCLDELDKVRGEARGDALRLLQGDAALVLERERLVVRATVVVTLNAGTDPRDVLPADRLRRMVHVSTAGVAEAASRRAARRLFDEGEVPVLDLDRLDVPAGVPGPEVSRFFDEQVVRSLRPEARALYPSHALALIVAGRMALDGTDEATAAEAVAADYLTCAASWGGVLPGAPARVGAGVRLPVPAEDDDEHEHDERAERVRLAQAKALGAKRLGAWRRSLAQAHDDEAVALRAGLDEVVAQLRAARSMVEVHQIAALASGLLAAIERRAADLEVASAPARPRHPESAAGGGRLAMLTALADSGSRERPGVVLERLGIAEPWPWPPGELSGKRWRGSTPETRGAVLYDDTPWDDLAVRAILRQAIDAERARTPSPSLALVAGL